MGEGTFHNDTDLTGFSSYFGLCGFALRPLELAPLGFLLSGFFSSCYVHDKDFMKKKVSHGMVEDRTAQAAWQGGKNTGYLPRDSASSVCLILVVWFGKITFPTWTLLFSSLKC